MEFRRRVEAIARKQMGLIRRGQALAAGMSRRQVGYRVQRREWFEVAYGVYSFRSSKPTRPEAIFAQLLSLPDGAAASHDTAAELWNLPGSRSTGIHLVVPREAKVKRKGVSIHLSRDLNPSLVQLACEVPVTCIELTLIDLAASWNEKDLERALEDALNRLTTVAKLEAVMGWVGERGRRGLGPLRRLLKRRGAGQVSHGSVLETDFEQLCRRYGIPAPSRQVQIGTMRVDFVWVAAKVVAEVDGRSIHAQHSAWSKDLERRSELAARGYRVMSFDARQIRKGAPAVADKLRRVLNLAGQDSSPSALPAPAPAPAVRKAKPA